MNCNDFQQWIAEKIAGELSSDQTKEMDTHEQTCPNCQRAVREWREMESLLRASWPSEDPRVPFFLPNPRLQGGWAATVRTWLGWVSMAAVTGCLLLLVILRPSVNFERSQLSINFGNAGKATPSEVITQAQVQAWVQQALAQAATETASKPQPAAALTAVPSNEEELRRVAQLAVQIEMLRRNQLSLWQQVQQHGLYLQSAWRAPADALEPNQRQRMNRP